MPQLQIKILDDQKALGQAAAEHAAKSLRAALRENGGARVAQPGHRSLSFWIR